MRSELLTVSLSAPSRGGRRWWLGGMATKGCGTSGRERVSHRLEPQKEKKHNSKKKTRGAGNNDRKVHTREHGHKNEERG